MQLLDELSMTSQHRENYFPVPLDTISLKYNWLFGGIEGRNRGHTKGGTASTPYG